MVITWFMGLCDFIQFQTILPNDDPPLQTTAPIDGTFFGDVKLFRMALWKLHALHVKTLTVHL